MTTGLQSKQGAELFSGWTPLASSVLQAVDAHQFDGARSAFAEVDAVATKIRDSLQVEDEPLLNDLWIIRAYFRLLVQYAEVWEQILQERFVASWSTLQDALDSIRAIKRVSAVEVEILELHLTNLEKAYPYKLFASIGAVASRSECSICGKDIDSLDCVHRRGQLYAGVMASSILRELKNFDHISLVTNPEDKRCVLSYDEAGPQFTLTRYLASLIRDRALAISEFHDIAFSKRKELNPSYRKLGRNEPCFCGSKKKFKLCCIHTATVEKEHAEVRGRRSWLLPYADSGADTKTDTKRLEKAVRE